MEQLFTAGFFFMWALFFNAVGTISIYEDWRAKRLTLLRGTFTIMCFGAVVIATLIGTAILTKGIS